MLSFLLRDMQKSWSPPHSHLIGSETVTNELPSKHETAGAGSAQQPHVLGIWSLKSSTVVQGLTMETASSCGVVVCEGDYTELKWQDSIAVALQEMHGHTMGACVLSHCLLARRVSSSGCYSPFYCPDQTT